MPLNPPLRNWRGKTVWLVGASSGIGRALAEALYAAGAHIVLSARQAALLQDFVQAHPGSRALPLDVLDGPALQAAVRQLTPEGIDLCVYCAGYYQPLRAQQFARDVAMRHLEVNYIGALHLLEALLPQLLSQAHTGRGGHLSLVSSVAGFRGLPKALGYGPTKAALTHLAEALYLDLAPEGLGVSVVHPGFVATPLTAGNDFHMPALLTPEQAAAAMLSGWASGRFEIHFPRRFTVWLKLLRLLPYGLYFAAVRRGTGL